VTDVAICGYNYTGNYSEFATQACNYCTPNLETYFISTCDALNDTKIVTYNYTNEFACCFTTGLTADCDMGQYDFMRSGTWAFYYVETPCSIYTYTSEDLPFAAISGVAKLIITIGLFAGLIALIYILIWSGKIINWKKWW
jgi:hypothetical protein